MNLFAKDKELILKITNAILILWLLAALAFTTHSTVNLLIKEPKMTYTEFKVSRCFYEKPSTTTSDDEEEFCKNSYESYKITRKDNNYYDQKSLYVSLANVIIVMGMMFILNPKKENSKKDK